jgi:hypothetical protein
VYGVVHTVSGENRYGWMALEEALVPCAEATPSVSCPGNNAAPTDACTTLLDCCKQSLQSSFPSAAEYQSFETECNEVVTVGGACGCYTGYKNFRSEGFCKQ